KPFLELGHCDDCLLNELRHVGSQMLFHVDPKDDPPKPNKLAIPGHANWANVWSIGADNLSSFPMRHSKAPGRLKNRAWALNETRPDILADSMTCSSVH